MLGLSDYADECLGPLEHALQVCADDNRPAVVIIEPIAGMALGIEPATVAYLRKLRAITRKYGAILIYDEVLSGNWRTGYAYAWQMYQVNSKADVSPDIVAIGKGLANGCVPLSAVVISSGIRMAMKSRKLWHSSTFQNHVYSCAIGLQVQKMQLDIAKQRGELFETMTVEALPALRKVPGIVAVEGMGLLYGIRLDPDNPGLHMRARAALLEQGVNVYTDGQTLEGGRGNTLMLAPPYVMTRDDLMRAVDILAKVIPTLF